MSFSDANLDKQAALATVVRIIRQAGEGIRDAYHQPRQIDHKGGVNLVTQADRNAETLIVESLLAEFPGTGILAEEGGGKEHVAEAMWLIDPLDGTNNFAHGFPVFCVSIALYLPDGPLLGAIYDPLRDELFTAIRGEGAYLNDQRIHVSSEAVLGQSLLATGFPYDRQFAEDNNIAALTRFLRVAVGLRRAGAAALDFAYVACGRLDGYWEMRVSPWDCAAGLLLVSEAGGRVTDYVGHDDLSTLVYTHHLVASNGKIHGAMLDVLDSVYGGESPAGLQVG